MPVDPIIGGSIIGGLGSALSGIGSGRRQRKNIREQKAADLELAQYSYGKDLEQWERENAYNAPTEQMARFREAGLNPHLIYGQGTPGNVQSSSPKYQQVRTQVGRNQLFDVAGVLSQFQDFTMKNAQIDNVRLQNQHQGIENLYANDFYWGRSGAAGEKYRQMIYNRVFDIMDPEIGADVELAGKRWDLGKSKRGRQMKGEIEKTQEQVKAYKLGNQLKQLEIDWFNQMKALGIFRGILGGFKR